MRTNYINKKDIGAKDIGAKYIKTNIATLGNWREKKRDNLGVERGGGYFIAGLIEQKIIPKKVIKRKGPNEKRSYDLL
jgi:hypothetical protein